MHSLYIELQVVEIRNVEVLDVKWLRCRRLLLLNRSPVRISYHHFEVSLVLTSDYVNPSLFELLPPSIREVGFAAIGLAHV